jgi:hypothetical protein
MNLKNLIIDGHTVTHVMTMLDIPQRDIVWLLGMFSATYHRLTTKLPTQPLDHVHAGIIRFIAAKWPDIPASSLLGLPTCQTVEHIEKLKMAYAKYRPIRIAGVILDLSNNGHLAFILFRSISSARNYLSGTTTMIVSVEIWVHLVIYLFETDQSRLLIKILKDEAAATNTSIEYALEHGW